MDFLNPAANVTYLVSSYLYELYLIILYILPLTSVNTNLSIS